jgi:hypothetical protein
MPTTNLIDRPTQQLSSTVAKGIFDEILSAMGGYALLQEALGLKASYLCRGLEGELIMRFDGCDACNKVKVELGEIDSYTMTFYQFYFALENRGCQVVAEFEGVGREQLQHMFEEYTGLSLVSRFAASY